VWCKHVHEWCLKKDSNYSRSNDTYLTPDCDDYEYIESEEDYLHMDNITYSEYDDTYYITSDVTWCDYEGIYVYVDYVLYSQKDDVYISDRCEDYTYVDKYEDYISREDLTHSEYDSLDYLDNDVTWCEDIEDYVFDELVDELENGNFSPTDKIQSTCDGKKYLTDDPHLSFNNEKNCYEYKK